jgi:dTDP-4-amino-4,6-dideoxygalactose transaminase
MPKNRIYLCLAHMSEAGLEQKYIQEAFDTNWVVPLGPNVNGFEKDLETFCGQNKRVVALSAGTAAVHLALIACGVKPGDEVCVQSFTFCASSHPITYLGATPVFIDSEKDSWNMDPDLLEEAIKDRIAKTGKKPKAIVPVALYGMPYDVDRIMEIANRYDIPVVEDAAEGFGSRWKGQVLGTFGEYGVLSFNGNKMITTSGGGALVCPDLEAKNKILWYATQAREAYPYYQHEAIGYNYRMSNICAGIGRGQMTVVNDHINHHKHVQKMYEELLADVPGIHVHAQPFESSELRVESLESVEIVESNKYDSNYWLCTITLDPDLKIKGQENAYKTVVQGAVGGAAGVVHATESAHTDCEPNANVEALRVILDQAGVEARPLWKPMHKQPVYRGVESLEFRVESLPNGIVRQTSDKSVAYINGVSESLFKVGMCLPSGPYVTDDDVRYIVRTIKSAIQ